MKEHFPYGFKSLNIGATRIIGGEISVIGEGKFGNIPTTLIAGYTYINPTFQDFDSLQNALSSADENVLKYRFKHTIKFDAESTIKNSESEQRFTIIPLWRQLMRHL